jgi:hypothetical protein
VQIGLKLPRFKSALGRMNTISQAPWRCAATEAPHAFP